MQGVGGGELVVIQKGIFSFFLKDHTGKFAHSAVFSSLIN